MKFELKPAAEYPVAELAALFTDSFKDYFVPVKFTPQALMEIVRRDLSVSRVLLADDKPAGVALIARRGWVNRVGGMGIVPEARGQGAASWMMERLIEETKERKTRELCLEVIEANAPAIHVYEKHGFKKVRRLVGFAGQIEAGSADGQLEEIDLRELGKIVSLHGLSDLPWQISGETLSVFSTPSVAYRMGAAYAAISNPEAEHVVIWSLLVLPDARRQGLAVKMLRSLAAKHPGKTWHVPPLCPEEAAHPFEKLELEKEEIAQLQMKLSLA